MQKLKPMDAYGQLDVPFDVAAYCRGRKLSIEAVELHRALKVREDAREVLAQAEKRLENAEKLVVTRVNEVRHRMLKDSA